MKTYLKGVEATGFKDAIPLLLMVSKVQQLASVKHKTPEMVNVRDFGIPRIVQSLYCNYSQYDMASDKSFGIIMVDSDTQLNPSR